MIDDRPAAALARRPFPVRPLELWGGLECTVNRVRDRFRDQFVETGHRGSVAEFALLARTGFAALRYPVSWERIAPDDPASPDWRSTDERLAHLRQSGHRVIAGLVHHGSGPAYTNLLDERFAAGLAHHARAAAARYPWIDEWTPVNEPLTTARFSALYGHWYPHRRDERSFWLALLNQIDATRLAMRAIRDCNPRALLVQTEDLGRTYATAPLRDQAAFDNTRRWISFDLLCGRVVRGHPLWRRLCDWGFRDRLGAIAADPCPPDVIGLNHYLTSDRFLDHRIRRYPASTRGGNGQGRYADIEAVRVLSPPSAGLLGALRETWQRYGLPLAVTEVHNGCTRDEQLRWMTAAWQSALTAREEGIDVRAVTAWALFGSAGWETLLTAPGRYEPGAFDLSGPAPRPTAMAALLEALARGEEPGHPVLAGDGWWQRDIRLHHGVMRQPARVRTAAMSAIRPARPPTQPLLIAGATGTLGRALAAACRHRDLACVVTDRSQLDLADEDSIATALERHRPWALINAAGWVRVDEAEARESECFEANAWGAARLAAAAGQRGIPTAWFSSDLVFDGAGNTAYEESHAPAPLNAYGRSKAEAERLIEALAGRHLIVRTAAFFSPFDRFNFAAQACSALAQDRTFAAAADQTVTPTYVPDLCDAVLDLVIDGESGIWHLTNGEPCTWYEFAARLAAATGLDTGLIQARSGSAATAVAPRPAHVPLISRRGTRLPSLSNAIERFARDFSAVRQAALAHCADSAS